MGCLEQRNPLTSQTGDEGVLCVIGGLELGTLGAGGRVPGVAGEDF